MKARALQLFRLIRGILVTAVVIIIIAAAVVVGVGRLMAPYADHARPHVERLLSERTGQPVSITKVEASWGGLTPVLTLHDLSVGETDEQTVSASRVQVEFGLADLLRPSRNPMWLAFEGMEIMVTQQADGKWTVGMDAPALDRPAEFDLTRINLGNLLLRNSRLQLKPRNHPPREFELPEIRLQTSPGEAALAGRIHPSGVTDQSVELRIVAELQGTTPTSVRAWLAGRDLRLEDWIGRLAENGLSPELKLLSETRLAFRSWLDWEQGKRGRLHGDISLEHWPAATAETAHAETLSLTSRFLLERDRDGIQLSLDQGRLGGRETAIDDLRLATDGEHWAVAADRLELAPLHALLLPWPGLAEWLPEYVSGTIRNLHVAGDRTGNLHAATGHVDALSVAPVKRIPGVNGLYLDIALDGDLAAITLGGEQPVVDWNYMLRAPVVLESLSGRVLLGRDLLIMENISVAHPAADAVADGLITWAGRDLFLDFHIDVPRATPDDPRPFLPAAIIPDTVLDWLDHALTGGERAQAYLQFFGRPRDWPWDPGIGEFVAHIEIEDADLGIHPGWPDAEALQGELTFQGRGMRGRTTRGRISGVSVHDAEVRIDDLKGDPLLILDIDGPGIDAGALAGFLGTIPVAENELASENLTYSGPVDLTLNLELPLSEGNTEHWRMSGKAASEALSVTHAEDLFHLDEVRGSVDFTRARIGPATLAGKLNGANVEIELEGVPGGQSRLTFQGQLSPEELLPPAWRTESPLPATGRSDWWIELVRQDGESRLSGTSDLVGTRLDLPDPLQKPEDTAWNVALDLPVQPAIDRFSFTLGDGVSLSAILGDDGWHWGLGLGGLRAPVPDTEQFIIRGKLNRLDVGGWLRVAGGLSPDPDMAGGTGGRMLLDVNELVMGTRSIGDVTLNLRRESPYWLLDVVGTGANGQLRLPASEHAARVAVGDFQRLHLSGPAEDEADEDDLQDEERRYVMLDPSTLPDLHLLVEDLRLGDLHAGRARVEAHSTRDGLEIETVQAGGDALRLSGRGHWQMLDGEPSSDFDLRLQFLDARQLLQAAGFESTMNARSGELALNAGWPGSPMDFDLRHLTGSLRMDLSDGSLPEARPGLGRVLSLISLSALPRRLQLDFRDVLGAGFAFDSLEGSFDLSDGRAQTDDLKIDSPAANIRITGTADLRRREYDQEILIRPGLGATLPVIGAIAGGPGGAAAGLALQGLFGGSLRDMGEIRYRVTGPWDDPVVEVVKQE